MREVKFRGYSKAINKFIYGCLVKSWSKKYEDFIDDKLMIISQNNNNNYSVDENSIGQYTGFKDKNGVEIYEGDIVEYETHGDIDTFINQVEVYFDEEFGGWMAHDYKTSEDLQLHYISSMCEVIGNIYEEKLKESK